MSENETRDGATVCELGVPFQVEKPENPGASCVFLGYFISSLPACHRASPWHPVGNSIVNEESLGLATASAGGGASSLATPSSRSPERNYSSQSWVEGVCVTAALLGLAWYFIPQIRPRFCF